MIQDTIHGHLIKWFSSSITTRNKRPTALVRNSSLKSFAIEDLAITNKTLKDVVACISIVNSRKRFPLMAVSVAGGGIHVMPVNERILLTHRKSLFVKGADGVVFSATWQEVDIQ